MDNFYELIDENSLFLVVYKGPGLSFHNEEGKAGLITLLKKEQNYSELYPVHRLDRVTSGPLIIAKKREVAAELGELFSKDRVDKYYLAISTSKPKKKQGLIVGDMVKSRRGMWKLTRSRGNPAKTRFYSYPLSGGLRLFLLKIYTGKTHQIRVAMKSLGAPILGDPLYNREASLKSPEDRTYLHAYSLSFSLQGKGYSYLVPPREGSHFLTEEFNAILENLKFPQK